ncbi:cytidylyltransferase domain-containing protein [Enterobacteriaceae bacterium LUAb1]
MNKKLLAIIPARAGSKRLPKKNMKTLCSKPLIAWTIEAALNSKYLTHIHVSTDDMETAALAKQYGLTQTKLRPDEISTDTATTMDVVKYVYALEGDYDVIVILQPTSPLREAKHIDEAVELYLHKNASSVISITECEHDLHWSNYLNHELNLNNFIRPIIEAEKYKKAYRLNGAIYIFNSDKLFDENINLYDDNSYGYIMNRSSSVDIDYQDDFEYAEFLMQKKLQKTKKDESNS